MKTESRNEKRKTTHQEHIPSANNKFDALINDKRFFKKHFALNMVFSNTNLSMSTHATNMATMRPLGQTK